MVSPLIAESLAGGLLVLAGTLLGALIASVTTVALARSKRRGEGRAFARLVEVELQSAADIVEEWLASYPDKPPEKSRESLDCAAWNEGRTVLAYGLRRSRWDTVSNGYGELGRLRRSLEDGGKDLEKRDIQTACEKLNAARETLHREGTGAGAATRVRARTRAARAMLLRWLPTRRSRVDRRQRRRT